MKYQYFIRWNCFLLRVGEWEAGSHEWNSRWRKNHHSDHWLHFLSSLVACLFVNLFLADFHVTFNVPWQKISLRLTRNALLFLHSFSLSLLMLMLLVSCLAWRSWPLVKWHNKGEPREMAHPFIACPSWPVSPASLSLSLSLSLSKPRSEAQRIFHTPISSSSDDEHSPEW